MYESLRDTIEAAVEQHVPDAPDEVSVDTSTEDATQDVEVKQGRTAGRPRDEKGRLLPGKAKEEPAKPVVAEAAQTQAAPARERPKYPSTWKKGLEAHWEKIDHDVADEIARREGDYAKGVSTYKTEYDRLKPLGDALSPYQGFFQQTGMKPEQYVQGLTQIDHKLRYGSPEDKLRVLAEIIQSNNIPLQNLLVRGEDNNVYLNQQYFQQQAQQHQAQGITPEDVQRMVQQQMAAAQIQSAIQTFVAAKDGSGNPLYPHFEQVKATMDGLLRAGLANDLPSAYDAALRMPNHADIFDGLQKQKHESEMAAQVKAKAEQAARARANQVSNKSQPSTGMVATDKERKGLREHLSAAFDAHAGSGRV